MILAACLLFVIFVLALTDIVTRKVPTTRDRGVCAPTNAERLADWERRRGQYNAALRLRAHRVAQALDARASVRPKVTPRLPR